MYKLMIVDDEAVIRDGLKRNIPWKELGVEPVCEAEDGMEAVELFEEYRPNIVLMDINLPFLNGLDVAHEILASDPEVKIIVITGHNDFEYAQKALKIGAFDLMLKPTDPAGISGTIKNACDSLDVIRNEKLKSRNIQRLLDDGLPILREKYIISLLNSNITADDLQIGEKLKSLEIDIESMFYTTSVLIPVLPDNKQGEAEMILLSAKAILEDNISKSKAKTFIFYDSLFRMVMLFGYSDKDTGDMLGF